MQENLNFVFTGKNIEKKYKINNLTENWFSDLMNLIIKTCKSDNFKILVNYLEELKKN